MEISIFFLVKLKCEMKMSLKKNSSYVIVSVGLDNCVLHRDFYTFDLFSIFKNLLTFVLLFINVYNSFLSQTKYLICRYSPSQPDSERQHSNRYLVTNHA